MYASSEKKIDILNDHYKDTFSHLVSYRKQRDRLLVYLSVIVGIMFLYQFSPEKTTDAISAVISKKIEGNLPLDPIVSILVQVVPWIFAGILSFKYFQLRALIESQRFYLEMLEKDLTSLFPSGLPFTRETNFSVKENRNLSIWSHKLYNQFFQIIFYLLAVLSVTSGLRHYGFSWNWFIGFIAWVVPVFIFFYRMTWAKRKRKET